MRRYIISYDLYRPGNNYSDLVAEIKRIGGNWEHPIANLWIVETDLSAAEIRAILGDHLITGDKLYICDIGQDVAAMDIIPGAPARMSAITAFERAPVKLLASVLGQRRRVPHEVEPESHLFMAATAGSCQSA